MNLLTGWMRNGASWYFYCENLWSREQYFSELDHTAFQNLTELRHIQGQFFTFIMENTACVLVAPSVSSSPKDTPLFLFFFFFCPTPFSFFQQRMRKIIGNRPSSLAESFCSTPLESHSLKSTAQHQCTCFVNEKNIHIYMCVCVALRPGRHFAWQKILLITIFHHEYRPIRYRSDISMLRIIIFCVT